MAAEAIKRRETFVYLQAIFEMALAIPPLHSRYPFLPTKALNPHSAPFWKPGMSKNFYDF